MAPSTRTARRPDVISIAGFSDEPHVSSKRSGCVCYNATDMGRPFFSARYLVLLSTVLIFGITSVAAQQPASTPRAASPAAYQPGIYLVFPFENAGAPSRLDWLGEGLEELTIQPLTGTGAPVYSHAGRWVALERSGV